MAAGEYVSVSSQADTERADLARERGELAADPEAELRELTAIYVKRGLEATLARTVAKQLMGRDALATHAREELGMSEQLAARPLQAAVASAASFAVGATLPIVAVMLAPAPLLAVVTAAASLFCLIGLGIVAARAGGSSAAVGAARLGFWGAVAMAVTAGVGALFGTAT